MTKQKGRLLVKDVMTPHPETIDPDESLQMAAAKMRACDIGLLPVSSDERLMGMLTDRDIVVRAIAEGLDPLTTSVRRAMTAQVFFCYEDEDLTEAAAEMEDRAVRRLAVMDREEKLVGILSIDDIAREMGDEALAGEVLSRVIEPSEPIGTVERLGERRVGPHD
jgi:CBS domain-containing protein